MFQTSNVFRNKNNVFCHIQMFLYDDLFLEKIDAIRTESHIE